jgi:hypothetical protein
MCLSFPRITCPDSAVSHVDMDEAVVIITADAVGVQTNCQISKLVY